MDLKLIQDGTTSTPRSAIGDYITIADYDMTVSTADGKAVSSYWSDPYHWYVCGCQRAAIGTKVEVKATYPAVKLPLHVRVPGASFTSTGTLELIKALGTSQPPSCVATYLQGEKPMANYRSAPAPRTVQAVTQPSTTTAKPAPTPINTAPLTPVTAGPAATTARTPINTAPSAPINSAPITTGTGVPVKDQPSAEKSPVPIAPAGPPPPPAQTSQTRPTELTFSATPAEMTLSWKGVGGGTYVVDRWKKSDPACCRATSPTLTTLTWKDPLVWEGTWVYRVVSTFPPYGTSYAEREYVYVPAQPPSDLKAEQRGRDTVSLSWSAVPGASHYLVSGPPSNVAVQVDVPKFAGGGVPLGTSTWKVATVFDATSTPGVRQTSAFATTTVSLIQRRYRLIAEAVRATSETVDQQESADGKYDEIFVAAAGQVVKDGETTWSPTRLSAVHGDVSWSRAGTPRRVQAGTASPTGGVRGGDVISPVFSATSAAAAGGLPNFVLWEGELTASSEYLLLYPTIWEADDLDFTYRDPLAGYCREYLCSWHNMLRNGSNSMYRLPAVLAAVPGTNIAVVDGPLLWIGGYDFLMHMELQKQDRPVGLVATIEDETRGVAGKFFNKAVILTREKLEAAIASGKNKVEVRYWDRWEPAGGAVTKATQLNGDYTLVIRIERF